MDSGLSMRQKVGLGVVVALAVLNILFWQQVFALASPRYLKVAVFDVGQGDSIFIETPSLRHIVIDGGPDGTVLRRLGEQLPFWERNIDVVILTHPDGDHLVGLLRILEHYHVDTVVWTGIARDGANYQEWIKTLQQAQSRGTRVVIAKFGTRLASAGAILDVINPLESVEGQFFNKTTNDTGIVSRLTYGQKHFLFTADISSVAEEALLNAKVDVSADVLKVGHHGSRFSTSAEFLAAVQPKLAVISVGAHNTYGHPTGEVLQRLAEAGITTERTDLSGTIEITTDGNAIKLKNQ